MVSTRTKYKFCDGEKVLCYEPDKTKAKVLYDSKVLEVKEGRGRRGVEYLIHFQGWNSSWDRCVGEEYVLKDTEENRKLQRDLAARSKLHIGAYLYRKDQKRKKSTTLSERVFEASNSCSSQDAGSTEDLEYLTTTDDDKESSVTTDDSQEKKLPLDFSPTFRSLLEADYDFINKDQKLVKLPAAVSIIDILEDYVRYFSSRVLRREDEPRGPRNRSLNKSQCPSEQWEQLEWITARVNLCKEMVDGLRICFDNHLGSHLLYKREQEQYEEVQSGRIFYLPMISDIKKEEDSTGEERTLLNQVFNDAADVERRRSLRSHKDAEASGSAVGVNGINKVAGASTVALNAVPNHSSEQRSTSSTSSCYGPLSSHSAFLPEAGYLGAELAKLIELTQSWRLVTEEYLTLRPSPPSTVYGAIHLARLFDKLPVFLHAANEPETENQPRIFSDRKIMVLLHLLQSFLTYLESKQEWFSEGNYIS